MKTKINLLSSIFLFISLLPNVSNATNCPCLTFFETKSKPDWISAEKITKSHYLTCGYSYCAGLQKIDTKRSDKSAKANLTRMIQA